MIRKTPVSAIGAHEATVDSGPAGFAYFWQTSFIEPAKSAPPNSGRILSRHGNILFYDGRERYSTLVAPACD